MSKAFTREKDGVETEEDSSQPALELLPSGVKNYITPAGAKRLRAELHDFLYVKRPQIVETISWAAANGDRSENADYIYGKRRLREIDRRIHFLTKRLESAEIVDPEKQKSDRVVFGATVTVRDQSGEERTYRIVGVDEIDAKKGFVSWVSPLGKTLLHTKVGDTAHLRAPKGNEELQIISILYEPIN